MPSKTISDSGNISVLTSRIDVDLCAGQFKIDITPTVYIGSGLANIVGAKVRIINPYDVAVKDFTDGSGYDITTPASQIFTFPIPTQNGNFQYGLYQVIVEVTDADGLKETVSGNVSPCAPNALDKSQKFGNILAIITGNCTTGKVTIEVDEPPVYKSVFFESKTQTLVLKYPTGSLPPQNFIVNAFVTDLFEGVYLVTGDVCVMYNMGDNVYIHVPYKIDCSKNILCRVDLCCVYGKLDELNKQLDSDCSADDVKTVTNTILDALRLLKTIELGASCGEDVSPYIEELEVLLKCNCTCSATAGTPVSPSNISNNVIIDGCDINPVTVGDTTTYTINNRSYILTINTANNFISVSDPLIDGCTIGQQLTFNIPQLYTALKAVVNNTTEYNFWANVIKQSYIPSTSVLGCLGISLSTYNALTYAQFQNLILTKICNGSNATCAAVISTPLLTAVGNTETISWTNVSGVFSVDVYIDGVARETLLAPLASYTAPVSGMNPHTYSLISRCSNGIAGVVLNGEFTNIGCMAIPAPSLSSNNVSGATCPYDLTSLAPTPATGFAIEWHNLNNRNTSSLVPNPTSVTSGSYFAFMVEIATGCSSIASTVLISCAVIGNCTEPLSLSAVEVTGGNVLVSFNSAATPPSGYLVKRRLASDPDISGSYTTIGSPTYNVSTSKWEITGALPQNILYVYKAESQCADGSRPYAVFTFARISCPVVTFTPSDTALGYSFNPLGGSIDKYIVDLYDNSGTVLLQSQTILPTFATPITGSFSGLSSATSYKPKVRAFIGSSFVKPCDLATQTTTGTLTTYYYYNSIEHSCIGDCSIAGAAIVIASTNPALTLNKYYQFSASGSPRIFYVTSSGTLTLTAPIIINVPYDTCTDGCLNYLEAGKLTLINLETVTGNTIDSLSDDTWHDAVGYPVLFGTNNIVAHTGFTGTLIVNCTVTVNSRIELIINNGESGNCVGVTGTGSQVYNLGAVTFSASDTVVIRLIEGTVCP